MDPFVSSGLMLSIVIPAFNEDNRLPDYLDQVEAFCVGCGVSCEILIVDDGSRVPIGQWLQISRYLTPIRVITFPYNCGKGAALKAGVAQCSGANVLIVDADGAYDIALADRFLCEAKAGADIVIPFRVMPYPSFQLKAILRFGASWLYRNLVRVILFPQIRDAQCGFKLFKTEIAKPLFAQCRENRWGLDTELLWRAKAKCLHIVQLPVAVRNDLAESKVSILPNAIQMLILVLRLRLNCYH